MKQKLPNNQLKILSWAEEDRPREKLLLKGKSALTDAELIAVLIGSGTTSISAVDLAKMILQQVNYNLHELAKLSLHDLMKFKGIGEAKAISIISALELGRRRKESEVLRRPKITCSGDAYRLIKPELLDLKQEEFWLILLNRANILIKKTPVSTGGISGTVADPKVIFKVALEHMASNIILVHNHPSGNLNPSEADVKLTKKLKQAGEFLELPVLDHLIFADHGYYSFADDGIF
ncbi:MAG: RadC family protein [Candidatus Cyclobacteriaceae bacterium M3_2C_046]